MPIDCAFYNCSGLTSVTIGNSVTSIGYEAFYNCSGLTSITIPDSVTSIGSSAFNGCTNIETVTIPTLAIGYIPKGNLKTVIITSGASIGKYAFRGCSGLTSVTIPDSVTSIDWGAFYDCSGLTRIDVSEWNTAYSSQDGILYNKAQTQFIHIPKNIQGSITIPDSVTIIGNSEFSGRSGLTNVTIGNGVTSIGNSAFRGCTGLTSITLPFVGASKTATAGYDQVFGYIFGYTTTNRSSTISGATYQYYKNDTYYYYYIPSSLKSVTITGGNIPYNAFNNCIGLTSVTIGNSVTSIGSSAFRGCSGLTSITIGNSVTSIGGWAFSDTAWYNSQPDGLVYAGKVLYKYKGSMLENTQIVIKEGTKGIASQAFRACRELTSVTIPDSVTSIGDYAFAWCSGLMSIIVNENNPNYKSINGNLYSKDGKTLVQYAIGKTDSSFTIPDSVTSIGGWAFCGCSGLTSVTIPDSVTSIDFCVFDNCRGLIIIKYGGTKEQWQAISKNASWNQNMANYVIYCTDGIIEK